MECICAPPGCTSANPLVFEESAVAVYADRVGAQGGNNNWVRCLAILCLRTNRILYAKKEPGDCGTASSARMGVGTNLAVAGVQAGLSAVPIVGGFLAQIANFLPFAHHAQAKANEQGTICDVSNNWAGFASAMEQALQQKQIALQDAIVKLNQFHQGFTTSLLAIAKPINAGYGYLKALDALALFNKEVVYPSLVPGVVSSIFGPSALGSKTGVGALAIGGGVAAAKIAGVF